MYICIYVYIYIYRVNPYLESAARMRASAPLARGRLLRVNSSATIDNQLTYRRASLRYHMCIHI